MPIMDTDTFVWLFTNIIYVGLILIAISTIFGVIRRSL
ncbi:hypothetical protein HNP88_000659 [Methanococcus maripaludis]|uniref:Uncharacterized protein n=1 Tax=Methanococcus maripaludis TaxID=39152 RepID=A0A7J9NLZ3_METMI|nr:hypothetical protein [Methanococcus maripaludis]